MIAAVAAAATVAAVAAIAVVAAVAAAVAVRLNIMSYQRYWKSLGNCFKMKFMDYF